MKKLNIAYLLAAVILFAGCSQKVWQVTDSDTEFIKIDAKKTGSVNDVEALILPYKANLDDEMNEVIAESAIALTKGSPESTLGNFVTKALKEEAEYILGDSIDFAVQNNGGLRIPSIAKGKITRGKIFELMPFDNMLVVLHAKGSIVKQMFNVSAFKGGWPVTDQVRMTMQDTTLIDLHIHGKPVEDDAMYKFAINDYIAEGGDKCYFLSEATSKNLEISVRDAILSYLERNNDKTITSSITGRVKKLK